MGEADGVAVGLADVGVVEEPVDGGGGQCFRHQLVEPGRVKVRGEGDGAFLVGGVDDPVEPRRGAPLRSVSELAGSPHHHQPAGRLIVIVINLSRPVLREEQLLDVSQISLTHRASSFNAASKLQSPVVLSASSAT